MGRPATIQHNEYGVNVLTNHPDVNGSNHCSDNIPVTNVKVVSKEEMLEKFRKLEDDQLFDILLLRHQKPEFDFKLSYLAVMTTVLWVMFDDMEEDKLVELLKDWFKRQPGYAVTNHSIESIGCTYSSLIRFDYIDN